MVQILNNLPTIVDSPGKYILRNGKFCTVHEIASKSDDPTVTQNRVKGSIWKKQDKIGVNPEYCIWHISGRKYHFRESQNDIVGKAEPSLADAIKQLADSRFSSYILPISEKIQNIRRIYTKNKSDPGDAAGDENLLIGLSIAEAYIGQRPGWIPEVQKIGCEIATFLDSQK